MEKKAIIPLTIILIVLTSLSSTVLAEEKTSIATGRLISFYTFETETQIQSSNIPTDPISPGDQKTVELTIQFKYTIDNLIPQLLEQTPLFDWIVFRDFEANRTISIDLNVESPGWCNAQLSNKTVTIEDIGTEFQSVKTNLTLDITTNADALEEGKIIINANFTPNDKWSLLSSGGSTNFTVMSTYNGSINAEYDLSELNIIENTSSIIIPSENYTIVPLTITNDGNGESNVTIEYNMIEDDIWNITIPNYVIIGKEAQKTIEIKITPPSGKERYTRNLTVMLNSSSTKDVTEKYDQFTQGISIKTEELELIKQKTRDDGEINNILLIAIIVIIVILIIVVFFVKRRKQ